MRAGQLDRVIEIQSVVHATDDYGGSAATWSLFATLRAQRVQSTTEEYLRGYGEGAETAIIFRTRFMDGITTDHRVTYEGRAFNIREVKELGRRRGLELRCEEVRS